MDDLVKRLRSTPLYYGYGEETDMNDEAADAIEALKNRVDDLEAALIMGSAVSVAVDGRVVVGAPKKFRATVKHDDGEVGDLPWIEEFWAVRYEDAKSSIEALTARAEAAEARVAELDETPSHSWPTFSAEYHAVYNNALEDAENDDAKVATAVAAMKPILRGDISPAAWNTDEEIADAFRAAIRALKSDPERG